MEVSNRYSFLYLLLMQLCGSFLFFHFCPTWSEVEAIDGNGRKLFDRSNSQRKTL